MPMISVGQIILITALAVPVMITTRTLFLLLCATTWQLSPLISSPYCV